MKKQNSKPEDAALLRQKAEEKLKLRRDVAYNVSANSTTEPDLQKLIYELEVHQIELEMQNEELLIAKEKAELAQEKYTELYDFASSGYIALSRKGEILELNFAAAQMLGKERSHLIKKRFEFFVSVDTQTTFNLFLSDVFSSKVKLSCEVIIATEGNLPIYVNIDGIVSQNSELCLLTLNDITERNRAKKELQESETRFRNLMERIDTVAVQGYGPNGITQFWNKASEKLYGYTQQEAIGSNLLDLIIPSEKKNGVTNAMREMVESGEPIPTEELLLKHKDGSPIPVISHHAIVKVPGHAQELFCLDVDISQRKQAEEDLRKSEEKLRSIYSVAPAGIGVNENRVLKEVNPVICEMTGYTREELVEKNARMLYPSQEEYEFVGREKYKQIREKGTGKVETLWQKKDGSIIHILLASTPVDKNDISKGTIFTALDITERKRAEAALRESEERFHLAMKASHDGLFDWNLETNEIYYSPGWKKMLGYADHELPNDFSVWEKTTEPEDAKKSWELQQKLITKQTDRFVMEFKMKHKDGHWVDILSRAEAFFNSDGKAVRIVGTHTDITERKQAEILIKNYTNRLELTMESASMAWWEMDIPTGKVIFNRKKTDMLGYSQEQFQHYTDFTNLVHPDDYEPMMSSMRALLEGTEGKYDFEYRIKAQSGEYIWFHDIGTISGRTKKGEPLMVSGIVLNITERKQAEEEIKKTGLHYQALIEKAPDGIVLIDAEGNFKYISPAAKKMFGYDLTDEVTGNPSEYTHPDDLQMVLSEMGKIFGDPTYVPTLVYRFVDKTGQWHWVETTFSNLLANPSVASIVLNFHDITERKLMEDAQAFLLQISNPGSDENFFESLAKYLAQCLDMQYVCIDLLEGDRLTAKTLAIYNEGNFDLNVSYALKDTPCGEVVGNHICCYPQKVRNLFPNDLALEDIKAESYIGTTLWSFDGKPIGLIAVIGQQPLQNQELAASLLKLVSLRAAGKLEAMLAEEKVKESEERFRVLIESTSVAIYLTDLHGKCTYVNPKWCEMAQLSYHQAMGDGWINGIYKEDREKVFEKWQQMVATDVNWSLEYRFGTPEKISWVYGTAKSYKNDSGQIAGFIGSNVDITERKLSEAIIRDIIEKNPMSIQILDMEGYPIQVNSAHTKLFGVKPPADYSVMQDQQLLALGFGKLFEQIKKGEVVYFPDSYYNVHDVNPTYPDSPAWVKALGFTLNDNNGNPSKIVLMHENITERKNAEALLNDIIDNNPMSIQVVDKAGITRRGNPAFVELFGAVPPPGFSIFDDLSRKSSELDSLVTQVLQGEIVHLPDIYFNAHDAITEAPDIPLWIRALIFPLRDTSGKPERFVFMHENITERKIAEQELIKAKDRAEESDRLKSAFLANMSHEIRTPMNGILGFSELLKEPGLTGDQQQVYIGIIEKSGLRMLNIINNIIDISKIEAGLVKLYIKESNINEQFEFIYTFFKPEVEAKGMKLTFKNSLASKEAIIHTDAEKLYAILTNLVKNAIKYTNEGSIEIGYNMVETLHATSPNATSPHSLLFYVKDTGIGIPKERQAAIFERFIQADISDKMAYQGAGLGLAITKAYVEMLGGKIWVESEVGRGSAFYFTLPYHAELHEKKAVGKVVALANERNQVNPKVSGLKIVIAEDDETSEMFISITLREFGKEIIKIKTGMEAVEICRNRPDIDLILMDIQMPGLSGYEAAKLIRQFNKNVVIIAQTAFGMSGDREKAINSGCNGYLAKPIDKNELFALIQLYFRK